MFLLALAVASMFSGSVSSVQNVSTEWCRCRNTPSSHHSPFENPLVAFSCTTKTTGGARSGNILLPTLLAIAASASVVAAAVLTMRIRVVVLVVTTILDLVVRLRIKPRYKRRH